MFPLSFAQQRIWFLQQLLPAGSTAFHVGHWIDFRGPLDRAALQASVNRLVQRHDTLRTVFEVVDGEPVQRIVNAPALPVLFEDLRSLGDEDRAQAMQRLGQELVYGQWDLAHGPLLRIRVWQTADDAHTIAMALHHIVCDWWSMTILERELFAGYRAHLDGATAPDAEAPIQCADYAVWQRQWLESEPFQKQFAFWQKQLAGAPTLRLPAARVAGSSARGLAGQVVLAADLTQRLRALSRAERVTPFMTLLTAFAVLLSRYSRQDEVVVGSPLANRTRPELEHVIGCFMNPLPFRVDLTGDPTFRDVLLRVRDLSLNVYANQDVPFDVLARSIQPRRDGAAPLFQAMFLLHRQTSAVEASAAGAAQPASSAAQKPAELGSDPTFPIALELVEFNDHIGGAFECAPEYGESLADLPARFLAIVEELVRRPEARIGSAALRRDAAAAAEPDTRPADVYAAFEAQVARTPGALALAAGAEQLTYTELQARVRALGARLRDGLADGERPIGVLLERSADAVITLLAVLESGASYLPLDPALPYERLAFMLQHAQVAAVVTRDDVVRAKGIDPRLFEGRRTVFLDRGTPEAVAPRSGASAASIHPDALAYVLFTSGSTGIPKAVAVSRGALSSYVRAARARFALTPEDRALQFASLSFDTAAEEIFPTLTSGAALVLRDDAMLASVPGFLNGCAERRITVVNFPTAYWHEVAAQMSRGHLRLPDSVRLVIIGGEKVLAERVRDWRTAADPRVRLLNTYGPTETTIVATMFEVGDLADGFADVPIGRAVPGANVHVLGDDLTPVPAGAVGELCIGGVGLARGYLHDPARTAERFVPDPVSAIPGARLYRTGDLCRATPDGELEYAGRLDGQVKLRGFRIEMGEIEAALLAHRGVLEAAALVDEPAPGELRLVAYVVPFEGAPLTGGELRQFLQQRLPGYMVPAAFAVVERLPRNIQGKLDRSALPPVGRSAATPEAYEAPQSDLEAQIAALWVDVLRVERVGVLDNFFDLGGHSLLVVKLHARMQETFGAELPLVDLFRFPTVQSQAAHLAGVAVPAVAGDAVRERAARQRQAFRRRGNDRPSVTA